MIRALGLVALLPSGAFAQAGAFSPPEGCTTIMTVQSKECRVSNYYACDGMEEGAQWRLDADQEGPYFLTLTNAEAEWVESHDGGPVQTLGERADPGSLSTLFATGRDTFDFWLDRADGTRRHVTGKDRLTGETVTIGGQSLAVTQFAFTERDENGDVTRQSRGQEYVSRTLGTFFGGPTEYGDGSGQWAKSDGRPVTFAFPGDQGYQASQPIFDCDVIMSGLPDPHAFAEDHPRRTGADVSATLASSSEGGQP
ncbi:hypothetical protein [Falsirhodobacter halotolerans]|uniref:hypothetical protein n=1 Tax=Falsirhodobacter halotolerans TaxID=1146892 RepID=UPI001FD0639B|nr:hypothetical protein [Falsirhodobacter halotolerans]MCJ8140767.1 hypothetical protein [Falsirhodobacter halotolerans]